MNEEQTTQGSESTDPKNDTSKVFLGDSTLQSPGDFDKDKNNNDDYYSVDNPKKDFNTNIGDGEMRNEGTVGEGNIVDDENPLSPTSQSDEQDAVDDHDSEG